MVAELHSSHRRGEVSSNSQGSGTGDPLLHRMAMLVVGTEESLLSLPREMGHQDRVTEPGSRKGLLEEVRRRIQATFIPHHMPCERSQLPTLPDACLSSPPRCGAEGGGAGNPWRSHLAHPTPPLH